MPQLLLTEVQADHLVDAIEDAIETNHGITVENDRGSDEYKVAVEAMKALVAVIEQIDPENPILDAEARPGHEFDWDAFWDEVEPEDDEEESLADRLSVAPDSVGVDD